MNAPDFTKIDLGSPLSAQNPDKPHWAAPEGIRIKPHYGPKEFSDLSLFMICGFYSIKFR